VRAPPPPPPQIQAQSEPPGREGLHRPARRRQRQERARDAPARGRGRARHQPRPRGQALAHAAPALLQERDGPDHQSAHRAHGRGAAGEAVGGQLSAPLALPLQDGEEEFDRAVFEEVAGGEFEVRCRCCISRPSGSTGRLLRVCSATLRPRRTRLMALVSPQPEMVSLQRIKGLNSEHTLI